MDLCGCKYSSHHIEGISQVLPKSTATSNLKKMFQRLFIIVQPSSTSKVEEVVNSNSTLSEKLYKIMDKCNVTEKCQSHYKPTFCQRTSCFLINKRIKSFLINNQLIISSSLLKFWNWSNTKKNTKSCAHYSHVACINFRLINAA